MDLPLLFDDNASGIRESFKDLSQFLKYDENSISDLTIKETFQKELDCIYEKTNRNKMSFLGVDGTGKIKKRKDKIECSDWKVWKNNLTKRKIQP